MKALSAAALVVGLVALVLSASLWMRQPASLAPAPGPAPAPSPGPVPLGGKNTPQTARELGLALIVLEKSGTQCVLSTKTPTSHGNQKKNAFWLIINNCSTGAGTVRLDFQNFQLGTTRVSPFNSDPSFTVTAGVSVVKALVRQTGDPDGTDYTFDLLVNGNKQGDPDIVIDN